MQGHRRAGRRGCLRQHGLSLHVSEEPLLDGTPVIKDVLPRVAPYHYLTLSACPHCYDRCGTAQISNP